MAKVSIVPILVWFRNDLRISDHPALLAALERGPVIPVFIFDPEGEAPWSTGAASRWWLHHSLAILDSELRKRQSRLVIRRGQTLKVLRELLKASSAGSVFWSRRYEPALERLDHEIMSHLNQTGIETRIFTSALLYEPETIRTKTDGPYQVFTPFWRACQAAAQPSKPRPSPQKIMGPKVWPQSQVLTDLKLIHKVDWAKGFNEYWQPGLLGARVVLKQGIKNTLSEYLETRDIPKIEGTSRLSPHLHFGEISIREVWEEVEVKLKESGLQPHERKSLQAFQRQLVWREFSHHLLVNFPDTPTKPLRPSFKSFPWLKDSQGLKAWKKGVTGYPYVDAGLRQLWATGWMHNRVRMAVASFLVKDLLIPWQDGAQWFWDTLVDADLAQNTMGWQWTAGCGADAAPYFRIFHPVTQGERFDPEGEYIRRWVPELALLPGKWIHCPWEAQPEILKQAKVVLGENYPHPLVDHKRARERALSAYRSLVKAR